MKKILPEILIVFLFIFSPLSQAAEQNNYLQVTWPQKWVLFGSFAKDTPLPDAKAYKQIPKSITINSKTITGIHVSANNGSIDLGKIYFPDKVKKYDPAREKTAAIAFAEITCENDGILLASASSDWWMQWYVDGKAVMDTMSLGNGRNSHPFSINLKRGKHILVVKVYSGRNGWTLQSRTEKPKRFQELMRSETRRKKRIQATIARAERAQVNSQLKIVIYGSSVALGTGAKNKFGWGNRLGKVLEKNNWVFVNKSHGGDTTTKLFARLKTDLLPEKPDVVIIGLSLANEGIRGANPDKIYAQYIRNMRKLIQVLRKNDIVPIISNCYPHGNYTEKHYNYILKFNEDLSGWPVYSFDFLGTLDDGKGHWLKGSEMNAGHPNTFGHDEMFRSIPPPVFDFLIDSNLNEIKFGKSWLNEKTITSLNCTLPVPLHSFTFGFEIKPQQLPPKAVPILSFANWKISLNPDGKISCADNDNTKTTISNTQLKTTQKNSIAVSYSYGRKRLCLYVNGDETEIDDVTFETQHFTLGNIKDEGNFNATYRNCLLYYSPLRRGILNKMFVDGEIPFSSLALFSPLNDATVVKGIPLINLAPTAIHLIAE